MLRYHFDVVCPYSYLLMREVEAAQDSGTAVEWVPYELRPAPHPLPDPRGTYIRDHWRDHVCPLALEYGIEIHVPVFQPRSTLVLAAGLWAEGLGAGRAWRDAAQRSFFIEGRDVSDERTLRRIARESGLDASDAVAAAWDPVLHTRLRTLRERAGTGGVHGVPSIAVGDELVFFGAPPPGTVATALAEWDGSASDLRHRLQRDGAANRVGPPGDPSTGPPESDSPLAVLRRWEVAGAAWRVVSETPSVITIALLTCDGGEEVQRLESADRELFEFLGTRRSREA